MLAGEGAAQFATLTQPVQPRQRAATATATAPAPGPSGSATLPLPAPQQPLQRSATLPISYGPKPGSKDRGKGAQMRFILSRDLM